MTSDFLWRVALHNCFKPAVPIHVREDLAPAATKKARNIWRASGWACRIVGKFLANSFSRVNAMAGRARNTRINTGEFWWAWVDLNHRPRPYQWGG